MRASHLILGLVAGLALTSAQAQLTDTRDYSTPGPGTTYFVDTDANKYSPPYYRYNYDGDWGWTHSAIGISFATASLSISAFDVDAGPSIYDELDNIYAYDADGAGWTLLGSLAGNTDAWAFTTFALGANFFNDIAAGLQVKMDIDANNASWAVTLAKSSLSVDGGRLPPAVPAIPEPETYAMMLAGLGLIAAIARRRKASRA